MEQKEDKILEAKAKQFINFCGLLILKLYELVY